MANPNTHHLCDLRDTWTECSQCYIYEHSDYYFWNVQTNYSNDYYSNDYYEDHTCIFTISTVCDPDFVDKRGESCENYAKRGQCQLGYQFYLDVGVMTDKGFMTAFNCPQCGCDENGPIRPDFATLRLG